MSQKILIVEDDSFLQGLASSKLSKDGFEVTTASDGDEAISILTKMVPDIILLDLVLPGTDGFGVLKKIRVTETIKTTPVIIFSNLAQDEDIKKAKELGANDFMIKSNFTLDELVEKIRETLKA